VIHEGVLLTWLRLLVFMMPPVTACAGLPDASPARLGFDADRLKRIDGAIDRAIERGQVPGVVVLVGRRGEIAYARAAGKRAVEPKPEAMTRDTIFDMASLTKPIATATAVMILIDEGRLRPSDHFTSTLKEWDNHGKASVTIEQLLRHRAGFIADNPLSDYEHGPDDAWKRLAEIELVSRPDEQFRYSDVGFMILGKLVERQTGRPLDQFARERIFDVLGMHDTHFRPIAGNAPSPVPPVERIAPTERDAPAGRILRGIVHDPRSRALGGVAGHAGLFATADDLAIFAQTILNGGRAPNGRRVLSQLAVRATIDTGSTPRGQRRGLGWDVQTSYSAPRGSLFGPTSFGHTGFTGTSLWIDPETETFVIILTSRLHPDGRAPSPTSLRAEIATLAGAALVDVPWRAVPSALV
jgi:CubicO group peptidase (beta-lactamase class C family)